MSGINGCLWSDEAQCSAIYIAILINRIPDKSSFAGTSTHNCAWCIGSCSEGLVKAIWWAILRLQPAEGECVWYAKTPVNVVWICFGFVDRPWETTRSAIQEAIVLNTVVQIVVRARTLIGCGVVDRKKCLMEPIIEIICNGYLGAFIKTISGCIPTAIHYSIMRININAYLGLLGGSGRKPFGCPNPSTR